ncbi:MAG: DegT/DnrJ/EryC1/StrS family aminotransferase [Gemmatimonadota bacterium]|jgi:dTDP-4-amino-4,6-dideoxygalactose transaminase
MPVPFFDLTRQYAGIRDSVDEAVGGVVESQRFILGAPVERLEAELAELLSAEHGVGCASGTDALLLSLRGLELPAGSEVVVPAFTFFATAGAVWNAGLKPVFCDIDPATFNVTAETVAAALTPDTRAVIVVHLFGQMADMAPIMALAEDRGLAVIEDAAQAIGARQRIDGAWRYAGAVGTVGAFSFFPTKNLGGFGDGGLMTTQDAALAERLRKLRVHGGVQMYHHEMVGTNSRLDALQAAVLSAKLPHLERWTRARQANAAAYDAALSSFGALTTPSALPHNEHVYNQYTVRVADGRRDALRKFLAERHIGSGVYYPVPLHLQACFASLGYGAGDLPASEQATAEVLSLPVFPELAEDERDEVIRAIGEFLA